MSEPPKHFNERPEKSCACSHDTDFVEIRATLVPTDDPVFKERQRIARERFAKRMAELDQEEETD